MVPPLPHAPAFERTRSLFLSSNAETDARSTSSGNKELCSPKFEGNQKEKSKGKKERQHKGTLFLSLSLSLLSFFLFGETSFSPFSRRGENNNRERRIKKERVWARAPVESPQEAAVFFFPLVASFASLYHFCFVFDSVVFLSREALVGAVPRRAAGTIRRISLCSTSRVQVAHGKNPEGARTRVGRFALFNQRLDCLIEKRTSLPLPVPVQLDDSAAPLSLLGDASGQGGALWSLDLSKANLHCLLGAWKKQQHQQQQKSRDPPPTFFFSRRFSTGREPQPPVSRSLALTRTLLRPNSLSLSL